jgi:hypothetical protein
MITKGCTPKKGVQVFAIMKTTFLDVRKIRKCFLG